MSPRQAVYAAILVAKDDPNRFPRETLFALRGLAKRRQFDGDRFALSLDDVALLAPFMNVLMRRGHAS